MAPRCVAITGATGFLGRHLALAFMEAGWRVRILARRDPIHPLWRDHEVEVVPGRLEDTAALRTLVADADLIVHAAGLTKARRDEDFHRVNAIGAGDVADAGNAVSPASRVILISSLAAREPGLSAYATSKRAGEDLMTRRLGERLTIVRPTAVYGPGDPDTWRLFAAAAAGWPLPVLDPEARITLAHVGDVARQVQALADRRCPAHPVALCDDRPDGYSWRELTAAVARAVGREPRTVRIPKSAIELAASAASLGRLWGQTSMLTPGKARELMHADWAIRPEERDPQAPAPRFALAEGFADTVAWARRENWAR